jgi:hypothetical protein
VVGVGVVDVDVDVGVGDEDVADDEAGAEFPGAEGGVEVATVGSVTDDVHKTVGFDGPP